MDRADIADVDGDTNTTEVLRFHYHQQALGSVTEISGPSGSVVEWVTYDVYGAATIRDQAGSTVSSSAVGSPFLFTGREYDAESDLYHYRARAYSPAAGQFLQRDPLGYVDGLSGREYARSRPAVLTDPTGRDDAEKSDIERAKEDYDKAVEDYNNMVDGYAEMEEEARDKDKNTPGDPDAKADLNGPWGERLREWIEEFRQGVEDASRAHAMAGGEWLPFPEPNTRKRMGDKEPGPEAPDPLPPPPPPPGPVTPSGGEDPKPEPPYEVPYIDLPFLPPYYGPACPPGGPRPRLPWGGWLPVEPVGGPPKIGLPYGGGFKFPPGWKRKE